MPEALSNELTQYTLAASYMTMLAMSLSVTIMIRAGSTFFIIPGYEDRS